MISRRLQKKKKTKRLCNIRSGLLTITTISRRKTLTMIQLRASRSFWRKLRNLKLWKWICTNKSNNTMTGSLSTMHMQKSKNPRRCKKRKKMTWWRQVWKSLLHRQRFLKNRVKKLRKLTICPSWRLRQRLGKMSSFRNRLRRKRGLIAKVRVPNQIWNMIQIQQGIMLYLEAKKLHKPHLN